MLVLQLDTSSGHYDHYVIANVIGPFLLVGKTKSAVIEHV